MKKTFLLIIMALLQLFIMGSSCEQDTVAGSNNLDRPTDLLILKSADASHSYVVTTNPRAQTLRFFDVTEGLFEEAPNLAFPLATVVGPGSHQLAKSPLNDGLFFVLDTVLEQVFVVQTEGDANQSAFTHARAPFRTPQNIQHIAVFQDGSEAPWELWMSTSNPAQIFHFQMSSQAPYDVTHLGTTAIDAPIQHIVFSDDGVVGIVSKDATSANLEVRSRALPQTAVTLPLPFVPGQLNIRQNTQLETSFYEIWVTSADGQHIGLVTFEPQSQALNFLGSAETAAAIQSLYVPKQEAEETTTEIAPCCYGLEDTLKSSDWLTTVDVAGDLLYWRWNISGETFSNLTLSLERFNSTLNNEEVTMTCLTSEGDSKDSCGTLSWTSRASDIALWNHWVLDGPIEATWQGTSNGLTSRAVTFNGDTNTFIPAAGLFPTQEGLLPGDEVTLSYTPTTESCNGAYTVDLAELTAESLTLTNLSEATANCFLDGDILLTVRPKNAFVIRDERHGSLGIARANSAQEFAFWVGHKEARFTLEDNNNWQQGEQVRFNITNSVSPIGLFLSQNFSYQSGGFGTYGNYAARMSGRVVRMQNTEGELTTVRQIYLVTETGALFEIGEGETDLANVLSYK